MPMCDMRDYVYSKHKVRLDKGSYPSLDIKMQEALNMHSNIMDLLYYEYAIAK